MTFGHYLREMRESRKLRQSDLAGRIRVSTVYICDIEKGRRYPPDFEKLRMLVEQLGLSIEESAKFYDLAGAARESAPPDILEYIGMNPAARDAIRRVMEHQKDYNWETILVNK